MINKKTVKNDKSGFLKESRKEIARVMSNAMMESGIDREEIAVRMSNFLGRKISKHMLDAYAAESRSAHTPAFDVAVAFDCAIKMTALSGYFVSKIGGKIAVGDDVALLELGRIEKEKDLLAKKNQSVRIVAGLNDDSVKKQIAIEILEDESNVLQLILGWLIATRPDDDGIDFLRSQAFDFEESENKEKYEHEITTLDNIREMAIEYRNMYPKSGKK